MPILAKDTGALIKGHFEGHYNGRLADELTCHSAHTGTVDNVCVCARACVDVQMCLPVHQPVKVRVQLLALFLYCSPTLPFFLRWSVPMNLDLIISAKLSDQWPSGMGLPLPHVLPYQERRVTGACQHTQLLWGHWESEHGSLFLPSKHHTQGDIAPNPRFFKVT